MRHVTVLIADSDLPIRTQAKSLILTLGHSVAGEADNGGQALVLARATKPDVVLLGIALGSALGGIEVARTLFAGRVAPVVLFGVGGSGEALTQLDGSGVMGFLSTPLRITDLGATLAIAVARFKDFTSLEEELRATNERMEARKLVGRAKAILMEKHGLTEREAFYRIQTQSTALGKASHEIARAIITASELAG